MTAGAGGGATATCCKYRYRSASHPAASSPQLLCEFIRLVFVAFPSCLDVSLISENVSARTRSDCALGVGIGGCARRGWPWLLRSTGILCITSFETKVTFGGSFPERAMITFGWAFLKRWAFRVYLGSWVGRGAVWPGLACCSQAVPSQWGVTVWDQLRIDPQGRGSAVTRTARPVSSAAVPHS